MPVGSHRAQLFPVVVVLASSIAIVTAFAIAKRRRVAYRLWLILVTLSILEAGSYAVADYFNWGSIARQGPRTVSLETIIALCWAGTYLIAYLMASTGVNSKAGSVPDSGDSSKK
jgi:hypothetical protein